MIHDLDLALSLSTAQPVAVEGEGTVDFSGGWDQARAEVTFDDGFTAVFVVVALAIGLTVSRVLTEREWSRP